MLAEAEALLSLAVCTVTEEYFARTIDIHPGALAKKKCMRRTGEIGERFPWNWLHASIRAAVTKIMESR